MQWGGIKNGALLALIWRERFGVFSPATRTWTKQQRIEGRPFAVLIMPAINWPVVKPHIGKISLALDGLYFPLNHQWWQLVGYMRRLDLYECPVGIGRLPTEVPGWHIPRNLHPGTLLLTRK